MTPTGAADMSLSTKQPLGLAPESIGGGNFSIQDGDGTDMQMMEGDDGSLMSGN